MASEMVSQMTLAAVQQKVIAFFLIMKLIIALKLILYAVMITVQTAISI